MALTRLDNLYSSKTGKYLYVSPDDFNATDALDNRGNSPLRPFKTIQRAFIEISRFSYVPGSGNDRFDQFSVMLMPGNHYIDNRPGLVTVGAGSSTGQPDRFFDASELITQNKTFIAKEAVDRMLNNNSGFNVLGGTQNCVDDVEDIIDAVVHNLKYGGNDKVYDAANLYVTGAHVQDEEDETVEVFEAARDIAIKVIANETVTVSGSHGLSQITDSTITVDPNGINGNTTHAWVKDTSGNNHIATNAVQSGGDYSHTWKGDTASNAVQSGGDYSHTWKGNTASNAVQSGGDYTHTWKGNTASNAVQSGGDYSHTWEGGTASNAVQSGGDYTHIWKGDTASNAVQS